MKIEFAPHIIPAAADKITEYFANCTLPDTFVVKVDHTSNRYVISAEVNGHILHIVLVNNVENVNAGLNYLKEVMLRSHWMNKEGLNVFFHLKHDKHTAVELADVIDNYNSPECNGYILVMDADWIRLKHNYADIKTWPNTTDMKVVYDYINKLTVDKQDCTYNGETFTVVKNGDKYDTTFRGVFLSAPSISSLILLICSQKVDSNEDWKEILQRTFSLTKVSDDNSSSRITFDDLSEAFSCSKCSSEKSLLFN